MAMGHKHGKERYIKACMVILLVVIVTILYSSPKLQKACMILSSTNKKYGELQVRNIEYFKYYKYLHVHIRKFKEDTMLNFSSIVTINTAPERQ
jgi:hypothetical protein